MFMRTMIVLLVWARDHDISGKQPSTDVSVSSRR